MDVTGQLDASLKALALGGEIAFVGFLGDDTEPVEPGALFRSSATVRVIAAGSRTHFGQMNAAITAAELHPLIARTFPFERARGAFRYYEDEMPLGKVVISNED